MERLNEQQQLAVDTIEGPIQILAGAGSGKTKVIVSRIANIIASGVPASRILALTFTNKAALEMKTRLEGMLQGEPTGIWIGTFHSICLRILRAHIHTIGYNREFVIYDHYDQQVLLKECLKTLNVNEETMKPAFFSGIISRSKDELITPEQYEREFAKDIRTRTAAKVYALYQNRLKANNAVDFDDMIFLTIRLLEQNPEVLSHYQERFMHILVDEYQDTNHAQYVLIRLLAQKYRNICVVGDDDQSIYGWRGADIRNILDFANEYKNLTTIKLEQNYRSTKNILHAANAVIEKNTGRKEKKLWTNKEQNEKLKLQCYRDDRLEAKGIAKEIKKISESYSYKDIAVLYRMNALSRILEEELINAGIPYTIYGGLKFYDRKEIKDLLAYLKLIANPADDIALLRIINTPKRGIGIRSIERIQASANINGTSLFHALLNLDSIDVSAKTKTAMMNFVQIIGALRSMADILPLDELITTIVSNVDYISELKNDDEVEFQSRIENIEELKSVAKEYYARAENKSIHEFLANIALTSDTDAYEENENMITLMTLHSSKGLEFPVVFMTGMEEGIFPSSKSLMSDVQLEEERRLCYVGMTRAKERLFLSFAMGRTHFGKFTPQLKSRFLEDIPLDVIEDTSRISAGKKNKPTSMMEQYHKKSELMHRSTLVQKPTANVFSLGTQVKHPVFGTGKIVAQDDSAYTIVFSGVGIKKIDKQFTKLVEVKG